MQVVDIVAIGSDHAGFEMKEVIKKHLDILGISYRDFGTGSPESVDYPDIAHPLAEAVDRGFYNRGILICGSGNGVAMVANKYPNVRAAICWNEDITKLSRLHNNANIIVLPGRFCSCEESLNRVKLFFETEFEGGRHQIRVEKVGKVIKH